MITVVAHVSDMTQKYKADKDTGKRSVVITLKLNVFEDDEASTGPSADIAKFLNKAAKIKFEPFQLSIGSDNPNSDK